MVDDNENTNPATDDDRDVRLQTHFVDEPATNQHLGHRSGFSYKETPAIGGYSPTQDTTNIDDSQQDEESATSLSHGTEGDGDDNGGERLQALARHSTLSKSFEKVEELAVVKKLDRCLVLFLGLLYLLSFLDRSNIGNARLAGLEQSLSISSGQFEMFLVAFYVTYITFEWMILLYRVIPAHVYIAGCVFSWGLVASLQSVVTNFKQLLVLRALLGVTEAAFGPGVPFYMTFFYRRSELAYRVGLQISAAPLATSFASTLAWIIMQGAKFTGIDQWRALFLVEGFPSIVAAVFAWYWIPDSPATARWLSPREKKIATLRLQTERSLSSLSPRSAYTAQPIVGGKQSGVARGGNSSSNTTGINTAEILSTLLDPKCYLTALMFLSVNVSFASLPVFLPTIINSMSFSPLTSQILSAPPYLIAFVFVLMMGHYSDKTPDSRSLFLCAAAWLSSLSYATIAISGLLHNILGETISITIRYVAIYPAAMGLFASVVLIITWTLNNQQSSTGKGTGMVILNVVGQCGPLIGVELFPRSSGPLYISGMSVCAAFMAGVGVLALVLRRYLTRLNEKMVGMDDGVAKGSAYEMRRLNGSRQSEDADGDEDQDGNHHHYHIDPSEEIDEERAALFGPRESLDIIERQRHDRDMQFKFML